MQFPDIKEHSLSFAFEELVLKRAFFPNLLRGLRLSPQSQRIWIAPYQSGSHISIVNLEDMSVHIINFPQHLSSLVKEKAHLKFFYPLSPLHQALIVIISEKDIHTLYLDLNTLSIIDHSTFHPDIDWLKNVSQCEYHAQESLLLINCQMGFLLLDMQKNKFNYLTGKYKEVLFDTNDVEMLHSESVKLIASRSCELSTFSYSVKNGIIISQDSSILSSGVISKLSIFGNQIAAIVDNEPTVTTSDFSASTLLQIDSPIKHLSSILESTVIQQKPLRPSILLFEKKKVDEETTNWQEVLISETPANTLCSAHFIDCDSKSGLIAIADKSYPFLLIRDLKGNYDHYRIGSEKDRILGINFLADNLYVITGRINADPVGSLVFISDQSRYTDVVIHQLPLKIYRKEEPNSEVQELIKAILMDEEEAFGQDEPEFLPSFPMISVSQPKESADMIQMMQSILGKLDILTQRVDSLEKVQHRVESKLDTLLSATQ